MPMRVRNPDISKQSITNKEEVFDEGKNEKRERNQCNR